MSNRQITSLISGTVTIGLGVSALLLVFVVPDLWGPSRDDFVHQTKASLESITTPEEAEATLKGCGTVRFPNGEWVTGVGVDSHSYRAARDTLMLRDSRGQVKVYVGHVCGPNYVSTYYTTVPNLKNLDDFYAHVAEQSLKESSPSVPN